jgi:hypothetical protein
MIMLKLIQKKRRKLKFHLALRAFGLMNQCIFQTNQVIKMIKLKVNENQTPKVPN